MRSLQSFFALPLLLVLASGCGEDRSRPIGIESRCDDGWDEDGDGRADCADPDCATAPTCRGVDASTEGSDGGPDVTADGGPPACTSECEGRECGDDGCGGSCGSCEDGTTCNDVSGRCDSECTPTCEGAECGDDGCGGSCGSCEDGTACTDARACAPVCTPDCTGAACGDDGCGDSCGSCEDDERCDAGSCEPTCAPDCDGKECGPDGCGGSCGSCEDGERCDAGTCEPSCTPDCDGKDCGADGCAGSCGSCADGDECSDAGLCASPCEPSCDPGQTCGPDGCGGSCGTCSDDRECLDCPGGSSCDVDTYFCRCPFFADPIEYTFDGTDLDWDQLQFVEIEFHHVEVDGTRTRRRAATLEESSPTDSVRVLGCEPNLLIVERNYYYDDAGVCMAETEADTVTVERLDITVPMPTRDEAGVCTVPSL